MSTPAYCTECHNQDDYPGSRGMRIADMRCRVCKAGPGTLARRGSARAIQAARSALVTVRALGGLADEHLSMVRRIYGSWGEPVTWSDGDQRIMAELDDRRLAIVEPGKRPLLTTLGHTVKFLLDDAGWS